MNKWPVYYSDTIHLSNPDSEIAIVCLWTKKERFIEKLDPNDYCYIGQLYSQEYGLQIIFGFLADIYLFYNNIYFFIE